MRRAGTPWLALALWCALAGAVVPLQAADDVAGHIKRTLEERLPNIRIDTVQPAPVPGLYEVFAGDRIAYSDPTGNYLFVGRMMDTRSRRDISADQLDAHLAIDFQKLPFARAIKIVKGNGKRQLALFADPDCPYCRQLEQSLRSITNVTIYLFLYPLDDVHPHASVHARAIWCSPDRGSAWAHWMLDRTPPPGSTCPGDPIDELHALGNSLQIHSTPTMFLENGRRISGVVAPAQLDKMLAEGSKVAPKIAAAPVLPPSSGR